MSAATIVSDGEHRGTWLAARATGVSASEVHAIAVGGRAAWQRILADKLNGESFKGNAETDRGRRREPYLLAYASEYLADVVPSKALYAHPDNPRHLATPDGIGRDCGVEAKSHKFGWNRNDVPIEHYDQCQWGMHVRGASRWLYVWEVMGEDGEPTLADPQHIWIERDEKRIATLVRNADAFLAWWDSGAPAHDDLPPELDDALAAWADARERKGAAEADEKAAQNTIRAHIAKTPGAEQDGLKLAGRRAHFTYSVTTDDELDAAAWEREEPKAFARWRDLRAEADAIATAAALLYTTPKRGTRLTITATKETAA